MRRVQEAVRRLAVAPIRLYQLAISPMLPPTCRFYPSCSTYAVTAIIRHGVARGVLYAAKRIGRCHPWSDPAVDHVPEVVGE